MSDSSESEYEVEKDGGDNGMEEDVAEEPPVLARKRKRSIDSVWDEIKEESENYIQGKMALANKIKHSPSLPERAHFSKVLRRLFGASTASQMVQSMGWNVDNVPDAAQEKILSPKRPNKRRKLNKQKVNDSSKVAENEQNTLSSEEKTKILQSLQKIKQVKVTEVVNFAGQSTQINKVVSAFDQEKSLGQENSTINKKNEKSGVDAVLANLQEPTKISTVTKSSADWENFKTEEGVGEELKKSTQDGYLTKKDFLQRCDERSFEQEKGLRNELRVKQQQQS